MSATITIVGCGGIGGLAGFYMAQAGESVTFVDQNREHVEAIRHKGLRVNGVYGPMAVGPQSAYAPEEIPTALDGLVFLACKSQATELAVTGILRYLTPGACVVSLQNGMNEEVIAQIVGRKRTLGALPDYGGAYLAPGLLEAVNEGAVYVGELDGALSSRAQEAGRLLGIGPNRCEVLEDIVGRVWTKQVYFAQILVSSLVDGPIRHILGDRRVQLLGGAAVREAIVVAEAAGVTLQKDEWFDPAWYHVTSPEDTERLLAVYRRLDGHSGPPQVRGATPSGYQYVKKASGIHWDIVYRKRKSEAAWLSIMAQGKRYGVEVPLNRRVLEMLQEAEDGKRRLGWENIDELSAFAQRHGVALPG